MIFAIKLLATYIFSADALQVRAPVVARAHTTLSPQQRKQYRQDSKELRKVLLAKYFGELPKYKDDFVTKRERSEENTEKLKQLFDKFKIEMSSIFGPCGAVGE